MNDEQKRADLVVKMKSRKSHDEKWASRDFATAQVFLWSAILASFCTAILAAAGIGPKLLIGFLAAVPGMAILVDRNFSFAQRACWHWEAVGRVDRLINEVEFKEAEVGSVASQFSDLCIELDGKFPGLRTEGLQGG